MTVLAAEDGRFFGHYDDLWLLGDDFDSLLDACLDDQTGGSEPIWHHPPWELGGAEI